LLADGSWGITKEFSPGHENTTEGFLAFRNATMVTDGALIISEISPDAADLFITGKDTAQQLRDYPRVIVLSKILSLEELTAKLRTAFEEEAERFVIG
jgi:galactitol-specific phosphotransferase system IIB component